MRSQKLEFDFIKYLIFGIAYTYLESEVSLFF